MYLAATCPLILSAHFMLSGLKLDRLRCFLGQKFCKLNLLFMVAIQSYTINCSIPFNFMKLEFSINCNKFHLTCFPLFFLWKIKFPLLAHFSLIFYPACQIELIIYYRIYRFFSYSVPSLVG